MNVHVNVEALNGRFDATDPPTLEAGGIVPRKTAERLSCDAAIVPLLESANGEPLAIGAKRRTVSPALRRALKRRDQGCRFPGCVETRFVDAHHIVHWARGGEKTLENLVLLCRHHHRALHEGGYQIEGRGRALQFKDPDGHLIPPTADDLSAGSVDALLLQNASAGAFLPPDILTSNLDPRPPDYAYITEVLAQHV